MDRALMEEEKGERLLLDLAKCIECEDPLQIWKEESEHFKMTVNSSSAWHGHCTQLIDELGRVSCNHVHNTFVWMIMARLRGVMLEQMIPPLKRRQNHAKTPFPSHSHSNPPPADGSHNEQLSAPPAHANTLVHHPQNKVLTDDNGRESNSHDSDDEADEDTYLPTLSNSKKLATSLNTNPDLHSGSKYTSELQDHSEYADADGLESIPFTDLPTEEGSMSRNKGGKLKSALKHTHKASLVMLNQLSWLTSLHSSANVKQGVPGSTWKSPCVRKAPARPDADVPSPDAKRSHKQTGSNQKQK
ncbi:hypothetical protein BKA82DRAFT_4016012 [Pisolithus tinctorius]|nr:hypothetical protein BKA82DRAFT_4016012 [Pisolithus tinctorius]